MPIVSCPACRRRLKTRDAAPGRKVRCPSCGETFLAPEAGADEDPELAAERPSESGEDTYALQSEVSPARPPSRRRDGGSSRRRRRPVSGPDDEDGSDLRPHRGPLILTLGILSVILSCIPLAGWILGAASMTMGSTDEHLMELRAMDRSGHGMTRTGQILGIFGVFFATVVFILALYIRMSRFARHW